VYVWIATAKEKEKENEHDNNMISILRPSVQCGNAQTKKGKEKSQRRSNNASIPAIGGLAVKTYLFISIHPTDQSDGIPPGYTFD